MNYNEILDDNEMDKIIFIHNIPRLFDDFLITTGIIHYDHTSAIHTSLLYEYCLGRAIAQDYTLEEYHVIMNAVMRYALEKSRESVGGE